MASATIEIIQGDSLQVLNPIPKLAPIPDDSFDSMVTDPPAGIAFMAKEWDDFRRARNPNDADRENVFGRTSRTAPEYARRSRDAFIAYLEAIMVEAFRVLKPGAHALVWAIPRTSHWTATAVENAGFEIRDTIAHLFGSGFPKSADPAKAGWRNFGPWPSPDPQAYADAERLEADWDGWGTALKPAREDWILCRKPFSGTIAGNVLEHGTAALNIDGCRVGWSGDAERSTVNGRVAPNARHAADAKNGMFGVGEVGSGREDVTHAAGRWPANLVLSCACETEHDPDCAVALLDAQAAVNIPDIHASGQTVVRRPNETGLFSMPTGESRGYGSGSSGPSRFFYVAKSSRSEREAGLEHRTRRNVNDGRETAIDNAYQRGDTQRGNIHPTVKSLDLMRWLTRLITPPGGHVLDVFAGSGSTGMACAFEGFGFTGIELDAEHCEIARSRIAQAKEDAGRITPEDAERKAEETGQPVQLGLLE